MFMFCQGPLSTGLTLNVKKLINTLWKFSLWLSTKEPKPDMLHQLGKILELQVTFFCDTHQGVLS